MQITRFTFAFAISTYLLISTAYAFDTSGMVTAEIDYKDLTFYAPEIDCDEPVVKGDIYDNECLAKISTRLTYAFTADKKLKATLIFYNIFDEIMGEAKIDEILLWEEDHVDIVDFIYIYPDFDFNAVRNSHHIEWKIHKRRTDGSGIKK